jgi:hypothetical protein
VLVRSPWSIYTGFIKPRWPTSPSKRRMRPARPLVRLGIRRVPAFTDLPGPGGIFCLHDLTLVSQSLTQGIERSAMFNNRFFTLALASLTSLTVHPSFAGGFTEDFSVSPDQNGWSAFGDAALFNWNVTNQNLEVTWDSSQPNSYFYHSLGTTLTKEDDFSFSFDLRLSDFTAGINPLKPYPFQLALALLDLGRATQTNFVRGTGADSPELVEFSFFPDPGGAWIYGPSLTSALIDATGTNWATGGFGAQSLTTADLYHITLAYRSSDQTLQTTITRNGADFGQVSDARLTANFQDFQVNCFAICNYSDAGQDPAYAGSILAHGTVDNIAVTTPTPPVSSIAGAWVGNDWAVHFASSTNWLYGLERTSDFSSWKLITDFTRGNGGNLLLLDTNPPVAKAFYRVQAQRP